MKLKGLIYKTESFVKTNKKWIGFLLVMVFTAYAIATVIITNNDWISYLMALVYVAGMIGAYIFVKNEENKVTRIFDLNIIFLVLGTILTYEISSFGVSIVVSSALIGLIGYCIFNKYSVAIYTGSFAGMSSHLLFNRLEILLIAILTALVYQIVKTAFNGYGGRLGTIAFISTSFISFVFNKESLIAHQSYDIWLIFLLSIGGTLVTWILHNKFKQSPVLSSALPGLIIGLILGQLLSNYLIYSYVFFTATFVGMANNSTIKNIYESLFIGIILAIIFLSFFIFFNGYGGKMGLMAFLSIVIGKTILDSTKILKDHLFNKGKKTIIL